MCGRSPSVSTEANPAGQLVPEYGRTNVRAINDSEPLPFPRTMTLDTVQTMRWMRRRSHRVTITTGKNAGHTGNVESNFFQRTVDYPDEFANGYHVMLDAEELVTVRWDQVDGLR